ncbi:MAG: mitochondrial 54S ribosomal protein mrpl1 [Watsoniomyces obsoletus]|nr:MAG: mitochondrial 54S ribosomal protein mrpl1 [Watsoniomyces obsoletus]
MDSDNQLSEQLIFRELYDDDSDLGDDNLPYPTPLPRSDFLTSDFTPVGYLSTLHNRHQTLEDLRTELRTRSQDLSKELLDLVNSNYQGFLSLGSSLHGGEEKVEELKVGLLRFKKGLEGVRGVVDTRENEFRQLMDERRTVRKQIRLGKTLLELDGLMEDLEVRLMVGSRGTQADEQQHDWESSDEDEDDTEDDEDVISEEGGLNGSSSTLINTRRLGKRVQEYLCIKHLQSQLDPKHPFAAKQEHRIMQIKKTLLLDLGTALQQVKNHRQTASDQMLKIIGLYRDLDASHEAVRILKGNTTSSIR